jgi:hypothetical protein
MMKLRLRWPSSTEPDPRGDTRKLSHGFGLLSYRESNLGDDIQAFAARQFMPRIDYYVHRDSIGDFTGPVAKEKVKIILNGWFMGSRSWPPSNFLDPLIVSFHIGQHHYLEDKRWGGKNFLLNKASIAYLKEHGPVGCRDLATLALLESKGVGAYFSGCLTLTLGATLQMQIEEDAREEILFVEPNLNLKTLFDTVPLDLKKSVSFVSHQTTLGDFPELRLNTVGSMLRRYAHAKLVITSRLHCALPCVALGTPVLFVLPNHDLGRLPGLLELLNVAPVGDSAIIQKISWHKPIPNPDRFRPLAEKLSASCRQFLGVPELARPID